MARKGSERLRDRWMDRVSGNEGAPDLEVTDRQGNKALSEEDVTEEAEEQESDLGAVLGSFTGEADRDPVPGGWEGTDDATSTAPSDLTPNMDKTACELGERDPDEVSGRAYGGGLGEAEGGVTDLTGSPVEESRDWEHDSIPPPKR